MINAIYRTLVRVGIAIYFISIRVFTVHLNRSNIQTFTNYITVSILICMTVNSANHPAIGETIREAPPADTLGGIYQGPRYSSMTREDAIEEISRIDNEPTVTIDAAIKFVENSRLSIGEEPSSARSGSIDSSHADLYITSLLKVCSNGSHAAMNAEACSRKIDASLKRMGYSGEGYQDNDPSDASVFSR